jgi:hypothetical protein
MQMVGFAGIAPEVIIELKKGRTRTLEFINAQNVISAVSVNVDDLIFVSTISHEDLSPGDGGIVATVTATSTIMQRMSSTAPGIYYEERERLLVRLQMKFACTSHIRKILERGYCRVLIVEVAEYSCPRAK